jgi:hypothetical protein
MPYIVDCTGAPNLAVLMSITWLWAVAESAAEKAIAQEKNLNLMDESFMKLLVNGAKLVKKLGKSKVFRKILVLLQYIS